MIVVATINSTLAPLVSFGFNCPLIAPLLFARFAIAVSIHLDVRAVIQEERCLGAGCHLRAMGSTVAMKGAGGRHLAGWRFVCCLWRYALGVLVITVGTQRDHKSKRNEAPQQSGFAGAFSGFAQAIRLFGRAGGTHNVLCLLLPVLAGSDLERETLTEPRPLAVSGKGGDVGKYLWPPLSGRDESKAAIIVPFCKRAVYAHKYSSMAPLIKLRGCYPISSDPISPRESKGAKGACPLNLRDVGTGHTGHGVSGSAAARKQKLIQRSQFRSPSIGHCDQPMMFSWNCCWISSILSRLSISALTQCTSSFFPASWRSSAKASSLLHAGL